MKKYLSFIAGAALLLAAASCSKFSQGENAVQLPDGDVYHEVTLGVGTDEASTRASGTGVVTGEDNISSVQVFAFQSDGNVASYQKNAGGKSVTMTLRKDVAYTVWAVANVSADLSGVKTLSALQATAMALTSESRTGFQMAGSASLTAGASSLTVTVKRLVARINLKSVTQSAAFKTSAGAMTIKDVFLSNVVGNQNLAGSASASTWYNKMGRYDGTQSHFVTTSTAGAPAMTAADAPSLPYPFYCYANSSSVTPNGWSTGTYAGQHTMLVIAATFGSGSTVYYYPIDINGQIGGAVERNTTYDVTATISNYGSTDEPNKEITSGSATISVTAAAWTPGAAIDKTI